MAIYCKNTRCRYCFTDVEESNRLVCTTNPSFITIPESRVFVLKCNTYLKRDLEDFLRPICPIGSDGLFPGQLKLTMAEEEDDDAPACDT